KDISYFYPGMNASLLLHKLIPGIGDNSVWNYAKLRGAISKTGNVTTAPYQNEIGFSVATFFPYGSVLGYNQNLSGYPRQLNPEFVLTKEVGVELGFLKNRINFEATYYHQDNTDQILNVALSNTTGLTSTLLNAAEFTNKGVELDLKLTPLVKLGNLEVDFKVNYSHMKNEVTKVLDDVDELGIGNYLYVIKGQSAFTFKVPDYVRDSATGKVIVDRVSGMPKLDPNTRRFGQNTPTDILGLNLNVNWKGFTFGATAEYRTGNMILFDQVGQFLDDNGISSYTAANGRRAFLFPNSVVDDGSGKLIDNTNTYTSNFGRLYWNTSINGDVISNYLASGAFWKLREVSITYAMPSRLFKGNTLKGVTFGITGRNLATWRPKSNPWTDPEFSGQISAATSTQGSAYTGNAQGRSTGYNLPPTRLYGANVIFTF
ncbi:MAG: TonB-dependent receptor, partial [Pedobacter sp.]